MYSRYSRPKPRHRKRRGFLVLVIIIAMLGVLLWRHSVHSQQQPQNGVSVSNKQSNSKQPSTQNATQPKPKPKSKPEPEPKPNTNYCVGNTLSKLVLVSISKQHLWACDRTASLYNSAVVTGMELYPSDLTPPGTYHVYAKATNQDLKGCDATGCWDDHVSYWMPFLDNQYGQYGFHDAAWRKPSQFGNINIYAPDTAALFGSHGCVELPLATAKWLYNWAPVGTTVKVES